MKKHVLTLGLLSVLAALPAGAQIDNLSSTSVLVCRAHQCADTSYSMTKGFLFNKIAQMLDRNIGKTVLVCEADPHTHVCLKEGITIPVTVAFSKSDLTVQSLKLTDEKKLNGATGLDLVWDYRINVGDTYPPCELALSRLNVNYTDQVEITSDDVICRVTETGRTSLNATYNINYLDFDYGFIGAYYTIGVGEAARGDKTGYAMFRFTARPEVSTVPEVVPAVSETVTVAPAPVPEILKETAPNQAAIPTPIKSEKPLPLAAKDPLATVGPGVPPLRVVPQIIIQKPAEEPTLEPRVIKTTTIEKTVITSDGVRHITPPETRTLINGKPQ